MGFGKFSKIKGSGVLFSDTLNLVLCALEAHTAQIFMMYNLKKFVKGLKEEKVYL